MSALVQRFKDASARQINLLRGRSGSVWQTGFQPLGMTFRSLRYRIKKLGIE